MTDTLRDLLHESVADAEMPDVIGSAWDAGRRARRRRAAGVGAGVAAVALVVGGLVWISDRGSEAPRLAPSHTPTQPPTHSPRTGTTPYVADPAPDAHYSGLPVWWSPSLAQEAALPAYPDSPLPATIDVDADVTPLADHPIRRALAAFAASTDDGSLEYVRVLAPDGRLLAVDTSPVKPMTDPEGNQRIRVGPSLLSRSGQYLLFPQERSLLVYTLRTGEWRTILTGNAPTWDATWIGNTRISLARPSDPLRSVPEYSIDGTQEGSGNVPGGGLLGVPLGSSQIYGRMRSGHDGGAQAFTAGAPIPEPRYGATKPGGSDWISAATLKPSILLIPNEMGRQKQCCQVDGWIGPHTVMYDSSSSSGTRLVAWDVGTGRFWQVSRITGVQLGVDIVVSSYAQFPAAELPMPY